MDRCAYRETLRVRELSRMSRTNPHIYEGTRQMQIIPLGWIFFSSGCLLAVATSEMRSTDGKTEDEIDAFPTQIWALSIKWNWKALESNRGSSSVHSRRPLMRPSHKHVEADEQKMSAN